MYPFLKGCKLLRTQRANLRGLSILFMNVLIEDRFTIQSPKIEMQAFINFDPFKKGYKSVYH